MSFLEEILKFIKFPNYIQYLIAALVFLCVLIGWLVIRKFFSIWQTQVEKNKIYSELIKRYEKDPESKNMKNES